MAAGVPIIASVPPENDTRGIIQEAMAGVVVNSGDPKSLAYEIKSSAIN